MQERLSVQNLWIEERRADNSLVATHYVPGKYVAPGLAVVDVTGESWTYVHFLIITTGGEAGKALLPDDLCEQCALAAARRLAAHGGWDRPTEVVIDDDEAHDLVLEIQDLYGPCYPPPGVPNGDQFRVAGHVPGQVSEPLADLPAGAAMLIPNDMTDDEARELVMAAKFDRPWYEED